MRRLISILTIALLILINNAVFAETLKVGVAPGYPPVIYKEQGKVIGIEADLAMQVGKYTGMDIEFVELPWEQLEAALNKGMVDVLMSGVSITDARRQRVDFSKPYMMVGQMALIKADNITTHSSKMSMRRSDRVFGVENNTTGQQFVRTKFSGAKMISFPTVEQGIEALKNGQIDYFVHDAPTIWQYTVIPMTQDRALFGLYEYMTEEPLAWAVKKGDVQLLTKLNAALEKMQTQGLVKKITNRWIPLKIEVGQ